MKQLSLPKWRTSELFQVIQLSTLVDMQRVTNSAAIHMHSVYSAAGDTAWYSGVIILSAIKLNFFYILSKVAYIPQSAYPGCSQITRHIFTLALGMNA